MKHVKLFEQFNANTLPPREVTEKGETALAWSDNDSIYTTIIPHDQLGSFMNRIKHIIDNAKDSDGSPMYDASGYWKDHEFEWKSMPGIAYVVTGDMTYPKLFSFETGSFEPKTPEINYWITGEDNEGINPNDPPNDPSGDETAVYLLKRGMVISASPQGHSGPSVQMMDYETYFRDLEDPMARFRSK